MRQHTSQIRIDRIVQRTQDRDEMEMNWRGGRGRVIHILGIVALAVPVTAADGVEFFESRVRPILAKNCFSCHTTAPMAGLAMVSSESLQKGGKSGPALVP